MSAHDGVLVALSGGVDSAVALLRLAATGRKVEAAIVKLWPGDDPRSCCGPTAIARALAVAGAFGVRLHVLDQQARFARTVVEPFVAAYLAGETPNPCVACNPERLAALVGLADELGLARVATGHYARLVTSDAHGPFLARAVDRAKDQSYMLAAVPAALLARLEFPLGGLTKPDVRAAAREAGLATADEPESQEVCFALEGYRAFVEERGVKARKGQIVDRRGRVLGEHEGHWRFTIGQRRGLGVSGDAPLYVLERRAATNEIVVGAAADLDADAVVVRDVSDHGIGVDAPGRSPRSSSSSDDPSPRPVASADASGEAAPGGPLTVQLRYRSAAVPVAGVHRVVGAEGTAGSGELLVRLAAPFAAPAPGQVAVFYRAEMVVGAGVIAASAVPEREYDTVS